MNLFTALSHAQTIHPGYVHLLQHLASPVVRAIADGHKVVVATGTGAGKPLGVGISVVRRQGEAAYGEYRTKRVVLEEYERMASTAKGA